MTKTCETCGNAAYRNLPDGLCAECSGYALWYPRRGESFVALLRAEKEAPSFAEMPPAEALAPADVPWWRRLFDLMD